jgi:hypothetical protein
MVQQNVSRPERPGNEFIVVAAAIDVRHDGISAFGQRAFSFAAAGLSIGCKGCRTKQLLPKTRSANVGHDAVSGVAVSNGTQMEST